jgi:hypothetical protein
MINNKKAKKKLSGESGGVIVLMIGLYLIILAFFILLNAISESSESNYKKASNSLKTAFGFTSGELEKNDEKINISIEEFYQGISNKIKGVVSSYFPNNEFDVSMKTGLMKISIPTSKFFDGGDITINPTMYSFIFDVTKVLKNLQGTNITVEVNLTVPQSDNDNIDSNKLKRAALRASDIANIIIAEKTNMELIKASANLNEDDLVNLYINIQINDYQQAILSYKDFLQN